MGTRMMHYCITTEINKRLHFSNEIRLHLGGLAPDLTHPIYAPKANTHLVELNNKGKKRINYELFIQKHRHYFNDDFKEDQINNNESLEIYSLESVIDYINLSTRKTISLLSTDWVS